MGFLGINWGEKPQSVERDVQGNWLNIVLSSFSRANVRLTDKQKLDYVLSNPALLKVVAITADLGSLASVNKYNNDKIVAKNFLYDFVDKPNFKQGWSQFFWEYFFWIQTGTAYLYNPNNAKFLKENNPIQWLIPQNINWNVTAVNKIMAFIFTKQKYADIMKAEVSYNFGNGQTTLLTLSEIVPFFDLCSGIENNYYIGQSRIDALYKVIVNSEMALDAKRINLEMVQKFMVSGQQDPSNISETPMTEVEKLSIEEKIRSLKNVHAVKSKISIERFVDNLAQLELDASFNDDMVKIASIMNVPTEVLDINAKDTTYENQEKATGRQIEYSLKPKWKQLTDWFESQYGFQDIRAGYEDLSFNQVFEKDRAEKEKTKAETMLLLAKAGIPEEQINAFLGTNFIGIDYVAAQKQNTGTNQQVTAN